MNYLTSTLAAGILAVTGATMAQAGGLQVSLQAGSARDAQMLHTAIALYALHRDVRAGADIRQVGRDHAVALRQGGGGNTGIIRQRGQAHSASLTQQGGGNAQVILQFGRGAQAEVTQHGGQAGVLLQFAR